ncbi:MAG TPA: amidase, partial [Halieaceae bacterium]|nr:amidase [Halieaceae bacterium]
MSNEIVAMTATELLSRYSNGSLSPVEVTRAMLAQIQELDSEVNAYCLVDEETTLEWARAAEQRYQNNAPLGLLDGVPVAVKDVFLTPMWPTLKGSRTIDPASTLGKSAPCVAALERHGYVPL